MWFGDMTVHSDKVVFHGAIGSAKSHLYHWVQVLTAKQGELILADAAGRAVACRAAVIPPGVRHAILQGTTDGTMILLPAESAEGMALAKSVSPPELPESWARAGTATAHQFDGAELDLQLSPRLTPPRHPAIETSLRLLPDRILEGAVRLREISDDVGLSESRFAHLFSAQVGLAFRPYVRCLRLIRAVELAAQGHSLTDAAHGAGFADGAHLNRACYQTFGIPPTDLTNKIAITLQP